MRYRTRPRRRYNAINVKIPEFLTDIIDENLRDGRLLRTKGFLGRAHFAEVAVVEKLAELNLLSQQDIDDIADRRKSKYIIKAKEEKMK